MCGGCGRRSTTLQGAKGESNRHPQATRSRRCAHVHTNNCSTNTTATPPPAARRAATVPLAVAAQPDSWRAAGGRQGAAWLALISAQLPLVLSPPPPLLAPARSTLRRMRAGMSPPAVGTPYARADPPQHLLTPLCLQSPLFLCSYQLCGQAQTVCDSLPHPLPGERVSFKGLPGVRLAMASLAQRSQRASARPALTSADRNQVVRRSPARGLQLPQ